MSPLTFTLSDKAPVLIGYILPYARHYEIGAYFYETATCYVMLWSENVGKEQDQEYLKALIAARTERELSDLAHRKLNKP